MSNAGSLGMANWGLVTLDNLSLYVMAGVPWGRGSKSVWAYFRASVWLSFFLICNFSPSSQLAILGNVSFSFSYIVFYQRQ